MVERPEGKHVAICMETHARTGAQWRAHAGPSQPGGLDKQKVARRESALIKAAAK